MFSLRRLIYGIGITMNNIQRIRNNCLRFLDKSFNIKVNVVKINVNNTLEHEVAKFIKCYELIKDKKQIITESIFKEGGRADVLCLDDMRVFEIMHTESEKEALSKVDKYPSLVDIVFLKAKDILKVIQWK